MKRLSIFGSAMAMFAFAMMFSLVSCDPAENGTGPLGTTDSDYLLAGPEWVEGNLVEGTDTQAFSLNVESEKMLFNGPADRPNGPANHPPMQLGRLLRLLNLDSAQRFDVQGYLAAFRDCVAENRLDLRAAQMPIIQAANAARLAIIADLQAGTITAQEARALLETLRTNTRLQMTTNVDVVAAREALKACHDTLLANIHSILTADQILKWNRFFNIVI